MEQINTNNAPAAVGPYSQAVKAGNLIYTSGQLPIDPSTGKIESPDIAGQTEQALQNIKAILDASGSSLDNVIKTNCYLKNISDFQNFNEVYAKHFIGKPARNCVEVSNLPKGALLEIDVIAESKG